MNCLSGLASNKAPNKSPRAMATGMAYTRFFCSVESMFHMPVSCMDDDGVNHVQAGKR
jgi:hypothetical protein